MKRSGLSGGVVAVAGFWALALAAVSGALILSGKSDPAGVLASLDTSCLLEFSEKLLVRSESTRELLIMPVPEEKPAIPKQTLPFRGERPAIIGFASWYGGGDGLDGAPTASGEIFDAAALTAAHRTLPFGTLVRVTFLQTGESVVVRINDRGPFTPDRMIDLSRAAAELIGLARHGVGMVELEVLE